MRYCTRCLYPENHPLNIIFDDQGVCSGCRVHEEKDTLDWAERLERLKQIVEPFRATKRTIHDCVIPVSGARDSLFIVHFVKNVLGLNPLLVTYNMQYNTKIGIQNLDYMRTHLGCDLMTFTVSPEIVKRVTRETLRLRASMYWHCLAGTSVFPVKIATNFKIPLIIWGAHQGIDQVGMFSHLDEVEMTRKFRKEHDLMGLEAKDLAANSDILTLDDLEPFSYPHDEALEAVGVRGIYLGNYVRWDSKAQHEQMIQRYGYETTPQSRTFDTYNDVDSFHYSGVHDLIKFAKFGYGKVSDHASREIRLKRLSRRDGIELVKRYEHVIPKDLSKFLRWLDMDEATFWHHVNAHRDPRIWTQNSARQWILKDSIINHGDDPGCEHVQLPVTGSPSFSITPPRAANQQDDAYVLFHRGWVDNTQR